MNAPPQSPHKDVKRLRATPWSTIAGLAFAALVIIVLATHALARTTT